MMAPPGKVKSIWDEAVEAEASDLARRFDQAWKVSKPGGRPALSDFLDPSTPSRSASLLAILKVEIAHRHRTGETVRIESYRDRHPELAGDALVALIYEDFCLREEAGELAEPDDYLDRFPEVVDRLREVLEIHELVAEPGSTSLDRDCHSIPFPEVGQTISGFHLIEELGRGSFARVFLAHERQLGDRPVALKVSRTGSPEPQTLARLQHTHIVPVHSYRVDPTTGLHLLCMPFFGGVTLGRLLADTALREPRSGLDLIQALDRSDSRTNESILASAAREQLSRRSFARAVAWWGARMAEALQHAHDRGVLHRDIKPSNVLIASDGMPMLLDFNLSREAENESVTPERLGGTIAYMAPEHLEALVEGDDRGIDHRADIYSLGMVLYESLGVKPQTGPSGPTTIIDRLNWLLDERRLEIDPLSERNVTIPNSLRSVISHCLAPDPADRYASAADLALDLQAVADDRSLCFAIEPWVPRAKRWLRIHRVQLAVAMPVLVAILTGVLLTFRMQAERLREEGHARELIHDGIRAVELNEYQAASALFGRGANLLSKRNDLVELRDEATRLADRSEAARRIRDQADKFFAEAEPLRFRLLGFEKNRSGVFEQLARVLGPFNIGQEGNWVDRLERDSLDEARSSRLVREVDDLLFFAVITFASETRDRSKSNQVAIDYCDLALRFTKCPEPWLVLREWWANPTSTNPALPMDPADETSATACFRWYLLGKLASSQVSLIWLEQAARLEPSNFWNQYALAYERDRLGRPDQALPPCNAAIALRPESPGAWKFRSRLSRLAGQWTPALQDLDRAFDVCRTGDEASRVRLDRARLRQEIGDYLGARTDAEAVIRAGGEAWMARDAKRNLAKLVADRGFEDQALLRYNELIETDPDDFLSTRGRVRLQLRRGDPQAAEADLTTLLARADRRDRPSLLAERAIVRLILNRPIEAEADASEACRLEPKAAHSRLVDRARLASQGPVDHWPEDPDAFDSWPDGGQALEADLRLATDRLLATIGPDSELESRIIDAILYSAARDHPKACEKANQLVAQHSRSARLRRVHGAILARSGRFDEALVEVGVGLTLDPESSDSLALRGKIRVSRGEFEAGLMDLKVAADRGSANVDGAIMAKALSALGRHAESAEIWTCWLENDPNDPRGWLGLAREWRSLVEWDRALYALETATGMIDDRSPLLGEAFLGYLACLPARPGRWPRLIDLGRRMVAGVSRGG